MASTEAGTRLSHRLRRRTRRCWRVNREQFWRANQGHCRKFRQAPTSEVLTLAYYFDKVEYPVFLFFVDTSNGTVLYRFMQRFAAQAPSGWRRQKSITVEFDPSDNFDNQLRFTTALVEAASFTRDLHPGSVSASLRKFEREIESIDPRVAVRIDVINGKNHFHLTPKQPISFSISLVNPTPEKTAEFRNFIEKGSDLIVKANDIKFENAPIFEKAREGELRITHRSEIPGHVIFSAPPGHPAFFVQVPAVFWWGTKYISMRTNLHDSPLQLQTEFQPELWSEEHPFTCRLGFTSAMWEGKPVNLLPSFDSTSEFLEIFAARTDVDVKFFIQGNQYGRAHFGKSDRSGFEHLHVIVNLIRKVREICNRLQMSVSVPTWNKISLSDFEVVGEMHAVLFQGQFVRKVPKVTLSGRFSEDGAVLPVPTPEPSSITVNFPEWRYKVWGTEFRIGEIEQEYSMMTFLRCRRRRRDRSVETTWRGTSESIQITRVKKTGTAN